MPSEFQVDLDHLDHIVGKLRDLAGFLSDNLDDIDDKVATLQGTGWEGLAARAYADAHRQWSTGAREFADGVRTASDAAKAAHDRYTRAIDLNSRMLRG
ncbi:WXG100 family type VII secretion target [Nocardia sp. NPDC050799]|uniref:WXG100 family type VII secretion target n=1 Tax=Nocardia sp. NPDC050799 TaxID=3154842 RepID=UPI0033E56E7F